MTIYALTPYVTGQQQFDNLGKPLAHGWVYTYINGTTTPLATYSDGIGTPNLNPIPLDSSGRLMVNIWIDAEAVYTFVIKDTLNSVTTETINGIQAGAPLASGVSQIVAGANVTISPIGGTGVVTINADGGGGNALEAFMLQLASVEGGMAMNGVDYSFWTATELANQTFATYDGGGEVPGISFTEPGSYLVTIQQEYAEIGSNTIPNGLSVFGVRTSGDPGVFLLSPTQTTNFVNSTATPGYNVNDLGGYTAPGANVIRFTDTFTVTADGLGGLFYPVAYAGNYLTPTAALSVSWMIVIEKIGSTYLG